MSECGSGLCSTPWGPVAAPACAYEYEVDGKRIRFEAPTPEELVRLRRLVQEQEAAAR